MKLLTLALKIINRQNFRLMRKYAGRTLLVMFIMFTQVLFFLLWGNNNKALLNIFVKKMFVRDNMYLGTQWLFVHLLIFCHIVICIVIVIQMVVFREVEFALHRLGFEAYCHCWIWYLFQIKYLVIIEYYTIINIYIIMRCYYGYDYPLYFNL